MRADKYFADTFGSRTKAAEAIEKGWVLLNGKRIKPKDEVKPTDEIRILDIEESYVSNGGYKLQRALDEFAFACEGKTFVDIGASTGGFTDCLLQHGAKKVYAVDVGESLLHPSLVGDKRIVQMQNTNARYLTAEHFQDAIDCVVTDVSFISLKHIFPVIHAVLHEGGEALVLIKPQFECEQTNIGKSGIVHPSAHSKIVQKVLGYAKESGLLPQQIVCAPVRKGKNIEYVLRLQSAGAYDKSTAVLEYVKTFIKAQSQTKKEQ